MIDFKGTIDEVIVYENDTARVSFCGRMVCCHSFFHCGPHFYRTCHYSVDCCGYLILYQQFNNLLLIVLSSARLFKFVFHPFIVFNYFWAFCDLDGSFVFHLFLFLKMKKEVFFGMTFATS